MKSQQKFKQQKIVLFDGVCNLCNGSVLFILKHEKEPILKFASIQSEAGAELLEWCGLPKDYSEAIVFIEGGTIHVASRAALRIGCYLRLPWSLLAQVGLVVPASVRDWVYRQIAQHRYRWFGKREVCMLPDESLKTRFL